MPNSYDDIINMPNHKSKIHPQMDIEKRAAQFMPFAALTGYKESIEETSRITDIKKLIDNSTKLEINEKINYLKTNPNTKITIEYFEKDSKKEGGKYNKITEEVKKIDEFNKLLVLKNNKKIFFEEIYSIIIIPN